MGPEQTTQDTAGLGRRERKKQEIEERIRRAALELFHEQGYWATTVEQIAERADVAKGTVFNYFPRKESLLAILAEEMLEWLYESLGPREALIAGGASSLRGIYKHMAEYAERDAELSRTMLIESMRGFWEETEKRKVQEDFRELLLAVFREAQARGEFRRDADPEVATGLMSAAYFTTLVEWLKECRGERPVREELDMKFEIIFRGLAGPAAGGGGDA